MPATSLIAAGSAGAVVLGAVCWRRCLRWGATGAEASSPLAGDEFLPRADLTATRAITVRAPTERVWPWIAQLGQGRGGFYSYDRLENLVGCHIHSADRVVPEWGRPTVGGEVRLHPDISLRVVRVDPGHALVVRGGVPLGGARAAPYDFTWAFVLLEAPQGATRLVVRERYRYLRRWARLIVEPVEVVSAVMSRRMLLGITERAEQLR